VGSRTTVRPVPSTAALAVFFVAKALQAIGVVDVGVGLYLGMTAERGLWRELELTVVGLAIFYLGRLLERRV
jgi:hypothetical protein